MIKLIINLMQICVPGSNIWDLICISTLLDDEQKQVNSL